MFSYQAQDSVDKGEPAEENYMHKEIHNKELVQKREDTVLSGNVVDNNVGQIHSPPREAVKFSGIFDCG